MRPTIETLLATFDAWKLSPLDLMVISKMAATLETLRAEHLSKSRAKDERMVSICRNPYGHSDDVVRAARQTVCDTLESVRADRDELLAENTKLRAERDALRQQQADDAESLTAAANTIRELRAERDALAALLRRVLSCTDLRGWNGAKAELLCADINAALAGDKP